MSDADVMCAPPSAKDAPNLGRFEWVDPLLLEDQLTEDERMLRDAARSYALALLGDPSVRVWRAEGLKVSYDPEPYGCDLPATDWPIPA